MRRNHGDKELTELQKVRQENKKLKRTIASLKKQLSRIDTDRFQYMVEEIERLEQEIEPPRTEESPDKWKCHKCQGGIMYLTVLKRLDGARYYRSCSNAPACRNRTPVKPFHQGVETGPKRPPEQDKEIP